MPDQNIDINAIKQALLARTGGPSMGQGQTQPMLSQVGKPLGPNPVSGGSPAVGSAPASIPTPGKPQPQFSSPFAGPGAGSQGPNFDDETRKVSKALIWKLLQVL